MNYRIKVQGQKRGGRRSQRELWLQSDRTFGMASEEFASPNSHNPWQLEHSFLSNPGPLVGLPGQFREVD